jgi:hypothetical protein
MTPPKQAGATIGLRTPAAWFDLDLDPATRGASIDRVLAERAVGSAEGLRASLEAAAEQAIGQGAVFASLFSDTLDGKAVSASLVVSVIDAVPDPASAPAAPAAIAEELVEEFLDDGATAAVRNLDAGPAARLRRRLPVGGATGPSGLPEEVDTVQYFVPFPDADRLAVLTFSTPNVGLADAFAEVFDAVASTLQWPS